MMTFPGSGVSPLESRSGEHELPVRFLISFRVAIFVDSGRSSHLSQTFSGIPFRPRMENFPREAPSSHSYARLSILLPSESTAFPSHRLHGSSSLARQVIPPRRASPVYTASSPDVYSRNVVPLLSFHPFVVNPLDPVQSLINRTGEQSDWLLDQRTGIPSGLSVPPGFGSLRPLTTGQPVLDRSFCLRLRSYAMVDVSYIL